MSGALQNKLSDADSKSSDYLTILILRALDRNQKFDITHPRGANQGVIRKGNFKRGEPAHLLWVSSFVRSGKAAAPGRSQQTIEVRKLRITPESAVPLSCPEPCFVGISALVSQKVETPFLNPLGKPDFYD